MEVLRNFPLLPPDRLKDIFNVKDCITDMTVILSTGETTHVYCTDVPILFKRSNKIYPTVYTLWKNPFLLPYFTTHSDVLPMLQAGADLMIAGVALERGPITEESYGFVNKNDPIFVNLLDNKAAIAVGIAHLSSRDMASSTGKGKSAVMLHVYGDELCRMKTLMPVPRHGPVNDTYRPPHKTTPNNHDNKKSVVNVVNPNLLSQGTSSNCTNMAVNLNVTQGIKPVEGSKNSNTLLRNAFGKPRNSSVMDNLTNSGFLQVDAWNKPNRVVSSNSTFSSQADAFDKVKNDGSQNSKNYLGLNAWNATRPTTSSKSVEKDVVDNENSTEGAKKSKRKRNKSAKTELKTAADDDTVINKLADDFSETLDVANPDNTVDKMEPKEDVTNMDDLLRYCFLKGLKTFMKDIKLPVLVSSFYRIQMMPLCPSDYELNVKKSSYKKISKFIQNMSDLGVIQSDEISAGVQRITSVNFKHDLLLTFRDIYSTRSQTTTHADTDSSNPTQPKVCQNYTVTHTVYPLFSEFLVRKQESLTPSDARRYITEYVKKKKLNVAFPPSVKLDDVLKNILKQGNAELPDTISWVELYNGIFSKMGHSYKIETAENSEYFQAKERKGKVPMISIREAKKCGNKTVTIIDNLAHFGIKVDEFAHECKKAAAASATVNHAGMAKTPQLQIQGNQAKFISSILVDKYRIPQKYIQDLTANSVKK